ncbi:MAG: hypothetical protein VKL59_10080 [Nostocaceae cyanobacterium]|nr:hypothetical protein [Nostocaceae cyanobacterium]
MIINDISHIEVATEEENNIQGGLAYADANGRAYASGTWFASTYTSTYTSASTNPWWWWGSSASSGSTSSSTAV